MPRSAYHTRSPEREVSYERLRELLHYDPDTGLFTWIKRRRGSFLGAVAGWLTGNGYVQISIDDVRFRAHRLAFLYMTGEWPEEDVDHINLIRTDNRWDNLRRATRGENMANGSFRKDNTSGYRGVTWSRPSQKWMVQIAFKRVNYYLGLYDDPAEAHAAYVEASERLHGEFGRTE